MKRNSLSSPNLGYILENQFKYFQDEKDPFQKEFNYYYSKVLSGYYSGSFVVNDIEFGFYRNHDTIIIGVKDKRLPQVIDKSYEQVLPIKPRYRIKDSKVVPIFEMDMSPLGISRPTIRTELKRLYYENNPVKISVNIPFIEKRLNPRSVAKEITERVYNDVYSFQVTEWEHLPEDLQFEINFEVLISDLNSAIHKLFIESEKYYNRNTEFMKDPIYQSL
jgi:hypothetical protein